MPILSKGTTFANGDQVTATKLNSLVDSATFGANIVDNTTLATSGSGTSATLIIKDLGVSTAKIAASAVTTSKIADANVTTAKILDANVTTAKIADANVTTVKIADANVTTAKIADLNVTTGKIADAAVTTAKLAQPLTRGTVVTTTGGTSIDFTSIPSWVKRITIMFNGVSTNGTDDYLVQIGDSGGVENTGYTSCGGDYGGVVASTAGFIMTRTTTAASLVSGSFFLCNITGNTWVASGDVCHDTIVASFAGTKTLSDVLDRVRITTVGGVNTFDAVSINIMYE